MSIVTFTHQKRHFSRLILASCAGLTLAGCASSGGSGGGSNPYIPSGGTNPAEVRVSSLMAFGDSYTDPAQGGAAVVKWHDHLQNWGNVQNRAIYAVGGASAGDNGPYGAYFSQQIDRWRAAGSNTAALTVLYFGYNDINNSGTQDAFAGATAGYTSGLDALISAGAASGNSRIFVTQIHDWGSVPDLASLGFTPQVQQWNNIVANVANQRTNVIAVDLFTAFNRVRSNPSAYGLVNVTDANASRAATDYLYFDSGHFGSKGHELIAKVYRHYLSRGWDWANSTAAGAAASQKLSADIDAGLVFGFADKHTNNQPVSFISLNNEATDFGHLGASSQQGLAMNFNLDSSGGWLSFDHAGLYLAKSSNGIDQLFYGDGGSASADSLLGGVYLTQNLFGAMGTTKLTTAKTRVDSSLSDFAIGGVKNQTNVSTLSLEQKVSKNFALASTGYQLSPWSSLTFRNYNLAGGSLESPYTTTVSYGDTEASALDATLGLRLLSPEYSLSGSKVSFNLGVTQKSSLSADTIVVTSSEALLGSVASVEEVDALSLNERIYDLGFEMHSNGMAKTTGYLFRREANDLAEVGFGVSASTRF